MLLFAILAIASCRTLPQDVADNNQIATTEATAFIGKIETEMLAKYNSEEPKSAEELQNLYSELKTHYDAVYTARMVVSEYLASAKGDVDAAEGYAAADVLLNDIAVRSVIIIQRWNDWVSKNPNPELGNREEFKNLLIESIAQYKVLDAKFQEWVKQFKVK